MTIHYLYQKKYTSEATVLKDYPDAAYIEEIENGWIAFDTVEDIRIFEGWPENRG